MDNKVMYNFTYGLFVLTTKVGDFDNGCIINTAIQATSNPNKIVMAVNKLNYTTKMILESKKFTISFISEDADFSLFKTFGFQSGKDTYKFDRFFDVKRVSNDTLAVVKGTNAYLTAKVEQAIDIGSHILFIANVEDGEVLSSVKSASYSYYLSNIKPKPQERKENTTGKKKIIWRCKVCGYEYEGETLPNDFICPLCKHPASDFERVEV